MSSIANDGVLMKPYIVRGYADKNNRIVKMYAAADRAGKVVFPM